LAEVSDAAFGGTPPDPLSTNGKILHFSSAMAAFRRIVAVSAADFWGIRIKS